MSFEYDNINTFLAGKMTVGVDDTVQGYVHKIEKNRTAKALEGEKKRKKKPDKGGMTDKPSGLIDSLR